MKSYEFVLHRYALTGLFQGQPRAQARAGGKYRPQSTVRATRVYPKFCSEFAKLVLCGMRWRRLGSQCLNPQRVSERYLSSGAGPCCAACSVACTAAVRCRQRRHHRCGCQRGAAVGVLGASGRSTSLQQCTADGAGGGIGVAGGFGAPANALVGGRRCCARGCGCGALLHPQARRTTDRACSPGLSPQVGEGKARDALEGGEVPPPPFQGPPAYAQPLSP